MQSRRLNLAISLVLIVCAAPPSSAQSMRSSVPRQIHVDGKSGKDRYSGTRARPFRTLSAAIARLPDPLTQSVTIEVAPANHTTTGGHGMPKNCLELMVRMRPGVEVRIHGVGDRRGRRPILAWEGGRAMVDAREGVWRIENVQIGSFSTLQRRGVFVSGTAHVKLRDITFRTRSHSGGGIRVERGGWVSLYGHIRLNEHLHQKAEDETFSGIVATSGGRVKFEERDGAHLDMGNGSLSASYYGVIRLGCKTARITSWGRQSNNLAVNNGGRIDLHGTETTLCARRKENTPIGPEHDGHILGEGAHVTIKGENACAITLQKASTFTCNDIELQGKFRKTVWAMSGSVFVGRFLTDVTRLEAHTGAVVCIEKIQGEVKGPVVATSGGVVSLPDGTVVRKEKSK
jgi:hypothetical protein